MALSLDDATATDGRLEAVVVELFDINILNGLPVREEEFHRGDCYAFDSLEIAHIGVLIVLDNLIEEHPIDIFRAETVHNLGEVLNVNCPALENHILGDSREVPAFDEAVEAVEQSGLTETIRQGVEVAVVDRLLVVIQRDVPHQHKATL